MRSIAPLLAGRSARAARRRSIGRASTLLGSLFVLACRGGGDAERAPDGWHDLFDGRDLAGWSVHGGKARFAVEDGVVVGTAVAGSANTFLCSDRTFEDFELELEFRVDPSLNSGVQIRSECFADARTLEVGGRKIELPADRVHGDQVEIDMDPARGRWWTAGLYDEARRGWLDPGDGEQGARGKAFTEQGRRISRPDAWNSLRIVANGPHLQTWLNGQPRAEFDDSLTPRGFIALQVHGVGEDPQRIGAQVRFRNVRLRTLHDVAATAGRSGAASMERSR